MYSRLRPLLFRADPENAHAGTLRLMQLVGSLPPLADLISRVYEVHSSPVKLFGLEFPNRVGLAAGYDKDGLAWRGLASLGFGHIEIGSVTPRPQPGNPKPRVFRLVEDNAIINRMGFPGRGAEFVAKRLTGNQPARLIIGVSLGINKTTKLEQAEEDYLPLMKIFSTLADYLAINVSSPNTAGLRQLQMRSYLEGLLSKLKAQQSTPLLVKLSPDLSNQELDEAVGVIVDSKLDGIIAANTTLARPSLSSPRATETGGLSGHPLTAKSREMVRRIYSLSGGKIPIIAVGGIMSGADAKAALNAGASLVQVFTGLIYRGPGLVKEIIEATTAK